MVVLLITSLKELAEDLQRGKSDSYENTRLIKVVTFDERGNPVETEKMSKYIRPGDIVKLEGEWRRGDRFRILMLKIDFYVLVYFSARCLSPILILFSPLIVFCDCFPCFPGTMASPVDLLLILTSIHADGNKCYIETANIDGETNLKVGLLFDFLYCRVAALCVACTWRERNCRSFRY